MTNKSDLFTWDLLNCNDTRWLRNLSDFCLKSSDVFPEPCFPIEHYVLKFALGLWCVGFGLIGFAGNLLTMFAIPYAAKKNQ